MPPLAEALKLTYEDYLDFPEDGRRHEIIDGDHVVTPSPSTRHQAISMNLSFLIHSYLRQHPIGTLLAAPMDVVLSPVDVVQPDLVLITADRQELITAAHIAGAPDLVVEILSGSTRRRDEVAKRKLYARFGVREYWLVDPERETASVLRLDDDTASEVVLLSRAAGDHLATHLLPGLAIPLADIFA